MKRKSFILIFIIIALKTLCFSCSAQTEAQKDTGQDTAAAQTSNNNSAVKDQIETTNWKTYTNSKNGFSFRYPSNLNVQKKPDGVRLYHWVKFRHQNPCDNRDDAPALDELVDFDITFKVVNKNFQTYKWAEEDRDSDIKLGKAGASGKVVARAYDGCGYDEYIYPLETGKSFIAEYQTIGLFSPVYADFPGAKEALQHPDLLKNEEEIVKAILESFELIKK